MPEIKADYVIAPIGDYPVVITCFNHGYPKLRKVGEMEIWNAWERTELNKILTSLGFEYCVGRDGDLESWTKKHA